MLAILSEKMTPGVYPSCSRPLTLPSPPKAVSLTGPWERAAHFFQI